jgi:hypothetical protein
MCGTPAKCQDKIANVDEWFDYDDERNTYHDERVPKELMVFIPHDAKVDAKVEHSEDFFPKTKLKADESTEVLQREMQVLREDNQALRDDIRC